MGFNFNNILNEELSISSEVLNETNKISKIIKDDILTKKHEQDFIGKFVSGNFIYNFFENEYDIKYKCYITVRKNYYLKNLTSTTYVNDKILDLNLSLIYENLFFVGPLSHEILHIFQYSKNKHDYLQYPKFRKIYNAARYIKNHYENYDENEINFAKALYSCFPFEQDAMTHCYYNSLFGYNIYEIQFYKNELDEYKFLESIEHSIENIDMFNENLFNNLITKNQFLKLLNKSYKRFKTKLNNAVKKVYKDKENLMNKLELNEGLI